jgi:quercetin dioxygenase-like cupin family protein
MAIIARTGATPRTRAIMVEARRLRSSIASWRAIPPRAATRKEVFDTAMQLLSKAGAEAPGGRPAALDNDAPFGPAIVSSRPPPAMRQSSFPPPTNAPVSPKLGAAFDSSTPPPPSSSSPAALQGSSIAPVGPKEQVLAPGITLYRPRLIDWRPFPQLEGVTIKVFHRELAGVVLHGLVRMVAGAAIPKHRHAGAEDILLVDGTLVMGDVTMRSGEYCHAEPGSVHARAVSPSGCTFLLIGSEKNEILPD